MATNSTCIPGVRYPYPEQPPPTITENISYPFEIRHYPAWEVGLKAAVYAVAMAMAIVGNFLVIWTVALNKKMRNSTNLYLANLAVSDLLVGLLNMWMHLMINVTSNYPFGPIFCKPFPFLQILALSASVLFLAVIAGERFFAIIFPLKARISRIYQHVIVMSLTWTAAALVALPNVFFFKKFQLYWADYHEEWCYEQWPRYARLDQTAPSTCLYYYPDRQIYHTFQVVVMYFLPILVMIIAYGVIVWYMLQRRIPREQSDSQLAHQQKTRRKVLRMLIIVFIVFIVCWTPQEIFVLIDANWPDTIEALKDSIGPESLDSVRYTLIFIAYFNSSLNPILYAGLNQNFRIGFQELFRCRSPKHNTVSPGTKEEPIYTLPSDNGHLFNPGVQ